MKRPILILILILIAAVMGGVLWTKKRIADKPAAVANQEAGKSDYDTAKLEGELDDAIKHDADQSGAPAGLVSWERIICAPVVTI